MNFLQSLKSQKEAREKYENESIRFKEAITELDVLYSIYDGNLLEKFELFIKTYKNEKQN